MVLLLLSGKIIDGGEKAVCAIKVGKADFESLATFGILLLLISKLELSLDGSGKLVHLCQSVWESVGKANRHFELCLRTGKYFLSEC